MAHDCRQCVSEALSDLRSQSIIRHQASGSRHQSVRQRGDKLRNPFPFLITIRLHEITTSHHVHVNVRERAVVAIATPCNAQLRATLSAECPSDRGAERQQLAMNVTWPRVAGVIKHGATLDAALRRASLLRRR